MHGPMYIKKIKDNILNRFIIYKFPLFYVVTSKILTEFTLDLRPFDLRVCALIYIAKLRHFSVYTL